MSLTAFNPSAVLVLPDDDRDPPAVRRAEIDESAKPQSNIDSLNLKIYSTEDLRAFTDNFSTSNLIGKTQFGQVYRGKIEETGKEPRSVTIKTWNDQEEWYMYHDDRKVLLEEERRFLTLPPMATHPNLVNLIGYCCEEEMKGVVYDLNSMDTLHNLMTKDNFGWKQRINVAIGLASVLEFLHSQKSYYTVLNVDTAHIMLDQDFNPLIFDFGLMSGGIIGKKSLAKEKTPMTPGYCDMYGCQSGFWTRWSDVYSYGGILIELIAKRITNMKDYGRGRVKSTSRWALESVKSGKLPFELVHPSLQEDQDYNASDALLLAELGMSCIEFYPSKRPKMRQIVKRLVELSIVKEQFLV
ncbi:hypothetical protein COLO4_20415 [Corchorus olitorius]|uniref:Protein kinase domain-containing protein n=1 Tax=Corchorus olitorius TaxID=93759 RepID=A0A1R3IZX7_9ROSI|nr:hypothetical protein COLO4_20415 [Corchorus olitorius]